MKQKEPSINEIAKHLERHEHMSPKFALTRTLFANCKILLRRLNAANETVSLAVNRYSVLEDRLKLAVNWVEEKGGCYDPVCIGHTCKSESPSLYQCDGCRESYILLNGLKGEYDG